MTNADGEFTPLVSDSSISTFRGAKIASTRWITVEPILVAASMGYGIMLMSQSQFIHEYYRKKYMVNSSSANDLQSNANVLLAETNTSTKIQEATTMWAAASTICASIGGIPVGFALGSYSDQIGRKIPMMISISGMVLCAMLNFVTIQFNLAIYFLLIGMCVLGLTGNFTLVYTMCMSYVADVTSEGKRMMRIVVLDVIHLLSMGLPMLGIGFLIRKMGYAFPFLIVTAANLLVLLYLLIPGCLLETVQRRTDATSSPIKIILKDTVRILKVKENYRNIRIILYMLVDFTVVGIGTGTFFVTILYGMGEPLCLSPEKIGFLVFCIFMFTGVGAMVGGAVLPFCLSTFGIMYVSLLSHQALFIATALATDALHLFLATSLGVFKLLAHPIVKTELSKMVASDEQGTLFAVIGITGSISELIFPVSFQTIYASSLSFSTGFIFYLSAGLMFVPWGIIIVLHCFNKKGSPVVAAEDSHVVETIGDIQ